RAGNVPRVYVVSNFQDATGNYLPTPQREFTIASFEPRIPRCLVTGYADAVVHEQRVRIEAAMASARPLKEIAEDLANESKEAAQRSRGQAGEACTVAYLEPDGSGGARVFGNLGATYLPSLIIDGQDVKATMDMVTKETSQFRQAKWTARGQDKR